MPPLEAAAPVVVYFHGNADQLGWGPAFVGDQLSQRHRLGFFGIEYPGYGVSSEGGSPSAASAIEASCHLLEHLKTDLESGREVVLCGQSIGCAVAVEMARRGFGSKLILISPFTSMGDMATTLFPFLGPVLQTCPWLVRDTLDNENLVPLLDLPTLIIHGDRDEIIPIDQGRALARKFKAGTCHFLEVTGGGHNDILDHSIGFDAVDAIYQFATSGKADGSIPPESLPAATAKL